MKTSKNDCGGFRPPKGHLDTQMYPECEGTETDRNIVKKHKKKKKASDDDIVVESKKKKKKYNPWAVCHTTVDKDEDPEKYERCVQDIKKKNKASSFNLKNYRLGNK